MNRLDIDYVICEKYAFSQPLVHFGSTVLRHKVRIVAGRYKGHRIKVLDQKILRPTSDRVRETLFNWIGSNIDGMRVLDLFAGSGALGFEALSRGATVVTFIEQRTKIANQLKDVCHRFDLSASEAEVVRRNCLPWINQDDRIWDLVFVDPPFDDPSLYAKILVKLRSRISTKGLIYLEHSKRESIDTKPFTVWKAATVGEVQFSLLTLNSRKS